MWIVACAEAAIWLTVGGPICCCPTVIKSVDVTGTGVSAIHVTTVLNTADKSHVSGVGELFTNTLAVKRIGGIEVVTDSTR